MFYPPFISVVSFISVVAPLRTLDSCNCRQLPGSPTWEHITAYYHKTLQNSLNDDNWNIISIFIFVYLFLSLIFIILSKKHTVKVSVLTGVNIRRIIIISGKCRVAQRSQILLDCLIHWVILRAIVLIYNEWRKPIYIYIRNYLHSLIFF